jgi:hypothetical protein
MEVAQREGGRREEAVQVPVDLWPHRLHKVCGQRRAVELVGVEHAEPRIEAHDPSWQGGLALEEGIEVVH